MARLQYKAICPAGKDKEGKPTPELSAVVEFDFHDEDIADIVEAFGEEVCKSQLKQKLVITLQAWVRARLRAGDTAEQIQAALDGGKWKPGMARPKKSNLDKALDATDGMSKDEIRALMEKIKGQL